MRNPIDYCPIDPKDSYSQAIRYGWSVPRPVPIVGHNESSGVFSLAFRFGRSASTQSEFEGLPEMADSHGYVNGVAVGGDYLKPNESAGTAAWSADSGWTWAASNQPPHGYRSAVQWSEALRLWITVGTNGSDISHDDGKTWQPLDDGEWNALSLPFVVGPKGRIARLVER
jgi:hypothetical protein